MIGTEDEPGLIPRTCYDLFQRIEKMTTATTTFTVKISYFEIYNEHVYDLLLPVITEPPTPLKWQIQPSLLHSPVFRGRLLVTAVIEIQGRQDENGKEKTRPNDSDKREILDRNKVY
ncbi:hypothetical protein V1515DRAFT_647150 [Lipomyces mesembrius]